MADPYDPKFAPRAPGRDAPGHDPLAELAKIVQGRPTPASQAAARQQLRPQPVNGGAAPDLEDELLNDLQASFAAVRDTLAPLAAAPPPKPRAAAPPPARAATRLTYKDQRRLETLEAGMPRLSDEIVALEARLEDPSFYARDRAGFDATMHRLTALRAELASAEEEWLELEERREALAKG
jgi:hypothetical protein